MLTGVVLAALLASTAAAHTGRVSDGELRRAVRSERLRTHDRRRRGRPVQGVRRPARLEQPDARVPAGRRAVLAGQVGLSSLPAVFVKQAGQIGINLRKGASTAWTDLGPYTLKALAPLTKQVKPFPAPTPRTVLIDNKHVKTRPIYRDLFDNFPQNYNVKPSTKPWIGVVIAWNAGCPGRRWRSRCAAGRGSCSGPTTRSPCRRRSRRGSPRTRRRRSTGSPAARALRDDFVTKACRNTNGQ